MPRQILWIDNDRSFLKGHIMRLKMEGYLVKQITKLSDGADEIRDPNFNYDLLILDVMMSVKEEEEEEFPPSETDSGRGAGILFYRKYKNTLEAKGIKVLAFTIRSDEDIRERFREAGLPESNFMAKTEGSDTSVFLKKVEEILAERTQHR